MYLHELGEEVDSFTKEDMAQGKHLLSSLADHAPAEDRGRMALRASAPSPPGLSLPSRPELSTNLT